MSGFRIDVAKSELSFAAGHFITYGGHRCERLHGHNYRVGVSVSGPLDADGLVYDFIALKQMIAELIETLDHRMLIQTENERLVVEADDRVVRVRHREQEYLFPRGDVALLPIANTSAELIAEYLADQLASGLEGSVQGGELEVEIEESLGQSATYRRPL